MDSKLETDELVDLLLSERTSVLSRLDSIEAVLREKIQYRLEGLERFAVDQINNRLLTLEWLINNESSKIDHILECTDALVRARNVQSQNVITNLNKYPKYHLNCSRAIAEESNDYLEAESTFEGSVSRPEFVVACERILRKDNLSFLDIGCGAGALVFDFLERGHFAVGVDGSDACHNSSAGYWKYLPHLHHCDVTREFLFSDEVGNTIGFDVITMWEVFEHIREEDCGCLLNNVRNSLKNDGLFVGSISKLVYNNATTGTVYHHTIKENDWWAQLFNDYGFAMIESPFSFREYYRGVGNRYQDPHSYRAAPEVGFHFVAKKMKT